MACSFPEVLQNSFSIIPNVHQVDVAQGFGLRLNHLHNLLY